MKTILMLVVIGLIVCAWSPWMQPETSRAAMEQQFDPAYRAGKPLFGGDCTLSSLGDLTKVPFGYSAMAKYSCEITSTGESKLTHTFYGAVIGVPAK